MMNVRKKPEAMKRGYEFFFVNRETGQEEPLSLVIHEVELRKLARAIDDLIGSDREVTGVEGVYLCYSKWGT
jgi:hypothetical protein